MAKSKNAARRYTISFSYTLDQEVSSNCEVAKYAGYGQVSAFLTGSKGAIAQFDSLANARVAARHLARRLPSRSWVCVNQAVAAGWVNPNRTWHEVQVGEPNRRTDLATRASTPNRRQRS